MQGALTDSIPWNYISGEHSRCPDTSLQKHMCLTGAMALEGAACLGRGFAADFGLLGLKFARQRLKKSPVEMR